MTFTLSLIGADSFLPLMPVSRGDALAFPSGFVSYMMMMFEYSILPPQYPFPWVGKAVLFTPTKILLVC